MTLIKYKIILIVFRINLRIKKAGRGKWPAFVISLYDMPDLRLREQNDVTWR